MTIEAMKLALEALDIACRKYGEVGSANTDWGRWDAAMTALRAAIEQAEKQEPVAVVGVDMSKVHMYVGHNYVGLKPENKTAIFFKDVPEGTPLYTAPPQRKEWQGLTDEEVRAFEVWLDEDEEQHGWNPPENTVKYLEAKLKERNV